MHAITDAIFGALSAGDGRHWTMVSTIRTKMEKRFL